MRVVQIGRRRKRFQDPQAPAPRKRSRRALKGLLIGGAVLALAALGAHWLLTHPFGRRNAANVLVIGADQEQHGQSRSDTVLLARIQIRPRCRVTVISLPRDTRVEVPGHGYHKLNAAYAFGGAALTRETVEGALGVSVDHVVAINSAGLAELVDALGGVDLNVPKQMDYDDRAQDLHIHLRPGQQRLNGEQAVGFVRYRSDGLGDLGRVQRQQAFVKAVAQQSLSLGALTKLGAVRKAVGKAVETDLTARQVLALGNCLRGISRADIVTGTVPGRPRYLHGVSYYAADLSSAARLLEGAAPPGGPEEGGPRLAVLNGCGRNGYAKRAARQLQAAGLSVVEVANAPAGPYPQTLIIGSHEEGGEGIAGQVAQALRYGRLVVPDRERPDGVLEVIIGDDYQPAPGF